MLYVYDVNRFIMFILCYEKALGYTSNAFKSVDRDIIQVFGKKTIYSQLQA